MPNANEFLAGFNLIKGYQYGGFVLDYVSSTHKTISRYQEYRYEITLVFRNLGSGTYEQLFYAVINEINQEHVIYGIRNPYLCKIDYPQDGDIIAENDGSFTFYLTGHGYRMYNH